MSRPLRIEFPGAIYHCIVRGVERRPIFRDDADRVRRMEWLAEACVRFGWRVHALCQMGNHEHLLIETPQPNLGQGMRLLNQTYTQYFNVRHKRCGPLFQGRYKAFIVEDGAAMMTIGRYIHLNPVRARSMGIGDPAAWPWSSFDGYATGRKAWGFMEHRRILGHYTGSEAEKRKRYAAFVRAGLAEPEPDLLKEAFQGLIYGSEAFIAEVLRKLNLLRADPERPLSRAAVHRPALSAIAAAAANAFGVEADAWVSGVRSDAGGRAVAAWLAQRFGYSGVETAAALGYRGSSGVTHAAKRVRRTKALLKKAEALAAGLRA